MAASSSSSSLQHIITAFLLLTLFLSATPLARESHFFSKVTKDDKIPPTFQQNNDPTFVPATGEDGHSYGLYGHETGVQLSPDAAEKTSTTVFSDSDPSYTTPRKEGNDLPPYGESLYSTDQEQQYKEESYLTEEERARSAGTYTTLTSADDDVRNQMGNYYDNGNQQQGLSDTRFMEGGKYFYDVNNEEAYNRKPTYNVDPTYRHPKFRSTSTNNGVYYSQQNGNGQQYDDTNYKNSNYVYNHGNQVYGQNQEEYQDLIHP